MVSLLPLIPVLRNLTLTLPHSLSQAPPQSISKSPQLPVIETVKINISLNTNAAPRSFNIYDILTANQPTALGANEWLQKIRSDRDFIIEKRAISTEAIDRNEVWKESHAMKPFSEKKMIRRNEKHQGSMICALNVPGMKYPVDQTFVSEKFFNEKWLLTVSR